MRIMRQAKLHSATKDCHYMFTYHWEGTKCVHPKHSITAKYLASLLIAALIVAATEHVTGTNLLISCSARIFLIFGAVRSGFQHEFISITSHSSRPLLPVPTYPPAPLLAPSPTPPACLQAFRDPPGLHWRADQL